MNADYVSLMSRFINRRVCLSLIGHGRIWGTLTSVNYESVRLVNTFLVGELEEQSWFSQLQYAEGEGSGNRFREAVVRVEHVMSVACLDEDVPDPPAPESIGSSPITIFSHAATLAPDAMVATGASTSVDTTVPAGALVPLEAVRLDLGADLVCLASASQGGDLLDRIRLARQSVLATGGWLPAVRVREAPHLAPREFEICVHDFSAARGTAHAELLLAVDGGQARADLSGEKAEGYFGRRAVWIEPARQELAESLGYYVVSPETAVISHLSQVAHRFGHELFRCEDARALLETLRQSQPGFVEGLSAEVPIWFIHRVLCHLLEERLALLHLPRMVESLACHYHPGSDSRLVAERVRMDLGDVLCRRCCDAEGRLQAVAVTAELERVAAELETESSHPAETSVRHEAWWTALRGELASFLIPGRLIALVTSSAARRIFASHLSDLPGISVMSQKEIPRTLRVDWLASLRGQ